MRACITTGLGLRKGAWTAQEDMRLKNCIEKNGEGKWHLVPLKAGLNRCRKSCRLRWLNYLRPDIKRGEFGVDEVDLILRLHKLLGNRWSLIAGRIPGRTANDVKNYWNTHFRNRSKKQKKDSDEDKSLQHMMTITIVKPQPRTFSKTVVNDQYIDENPHIMTHVGQSSLKRSSNNFNNSSSSGLTFSPNILNVEIYNNESLDYLFKESEKDIQGKNGWLCGGSPVEGETLDVEQEDDQNCLFDFKMDEVIWNLIDSDQL